MGLAGTRQGGLGLFLAGWGWVRGWKMGSGNGEKQLLSFQESPRALCHRENQFPNAWELWQAGLPPVLSQAQPTLLYGPEQASGSVWTEAESPVLF